MTDIEYREKFLDAVASVLSDQEQAGLDILANGDYHLDENLGGLAWLLYPAERMCGVAHAETYPATEEWSFPAGTILNEVMGGWRYPAVTDKVSRGRSWEFAKISGATRTRGRGLQSHSNRRPHDPSRRAGQSAQQIHCCKSIEPRLGSAP